VPPELHALTMAIAATTIATARNVRFREILATLTTRGEDPDREGVMIRKIVVAAVTIAASVALIASPAWAGRPPLQISPSSGPTGTAITVSGAECGDGSPATVTIHLVVGDTIVATTTVPIAGGGNGKWSGSITVPAGTAAGAIQVNANCFSSEAEQEFSYVPGSFTVTAPAPTTTTTSTTVVVQQATTTTTVPPAPVAPAATPVVAQPTMTG
jgi:hypothetical protein